MSAFLNPTEAARQLGVSAKALRLYEQRGLVTPLRTAAGWRAYGPAEMRQAQDIAALRALGFSLAQVARMLKGDVHGLDSVLSAHQATLEGRIRDLASMVERVRGLRDGLGRGQAPTVGELARLSASAPSVSFDLPWPWGGERFDLRALRPLTYITGPLGSGKTRLLRCLADHLPQAVFLGLERSADTQSGAPAQLAELVEDGATASDALGTLLAALQTDGASAVVVDMLEHGLDEATQEALIAHLRRRGPGTRPLIFTTRSTAILDLDCVGADETILFCPANHGVPLHVVPYPGTAGYEALASCLASPDVRARTEGVAAIRPAHRPAG